MKKFFLPFVIFLISSSGFAKTVKLEWSAIKGAARYEIQIQSQAQAQKKGTSSFKKLLDENKWNGDLDFGVYSYNIRAIDKFKRPGVWSQAQALVVMPMPPRLVSPDNGSTVVLYNSKAGSTLQWDDVPDVSKYQVEIKKNDQVFYTGTVSGTKTFLRGLTSGKYTWKVSAVIEADGRAPASLQGRRWKGTPSDSNAFEVETKTLEAPPPLFPLGAQPPNSEKKLVFQWKSVEGANAYEVHIYYPNPGGRNPASERVFTTKDSSLVADIAVEGYYKWEVKALGNNDENGTPEAEGPKSSAEFRIDKNALFEGGFGYIALSTMLAPYTYTVSHGALTPSDVTVNGQSVASDFRISGEYWFKPQWGVGYAVEDEFFQMGGYNESRKAYEFNAKFRSGFNDNKYGWFLYPKLGIEGREYVYVDDGIGGISSVFNSYNLMTWGPAIGLDLRKRFSEKFSLGVKASYYVPVLLSGIPGGGSATIAGSSSYRNLSVGLQGLYWLGTRYALGAGFYIDDRSLGFQPSGMSGTNFGGLEQVYMDGLYLFTSLVYTFGSVH